jgi:hypothetical protein
MAGTPADNRDDGDAVPSDVPPSPEGWERHVRHKSLNHDLVVVQLGALGARKEPAIRGTECRLHMPGLNTDHRQPHFSQCAVQPLR